MTRHSSPLHPFKQLLLGGVLILCCCSGCEQQTSVYQPAVAKLIEKAAQLKQAGNTMEAACRLKAAVDLSPDVFQVQYNLGVVYSDAAQWEAAISALEKAVHLNANQPSAWYALGLSYQSLGDQWENRIQAQPTDKAVWTTVPEAMRATPVTQAKLEAQKAYQNAIKVYTTFLDKAPQNDPSRADVLTQLQALQNKI